MVTRTPHGTLTKSVNEEMVRLIELFDQPTTIFSAIESFCGAKLDENEYHHVVALTATIQEIFKEGILLPDYETQVLASSTRLILRTLSALDFDAVLRVYRENPRFFQTLAGIDAPPTEYILTEMREGPAGYEAHKHFLGISNRKDGDLVGVVDFVVRYPTPGKGCLGLLLLSERYQSAGLGTDAAELVEGWAREVYGVLEVTIGVELVNVRARKFWEKCGYKPTGELFETSALGRTHQAAVLIKRIDRPREEELE